MRNIKLHYRYYAAVAVGGILLIVFFYNQSFDDSKDAPVLYHYSVVTTTGPQPVADVPSPLDQSHSVIRSNKESLYAMYGEGNFSEYNEHLLNYIRSKMSRQDHGGRNLLSEPSKVDFSQVGASQYVDRLLKQRSNGFFVECGAFNGEDFSDTLFFEIERNWTGLLIEAHPQYHQDILKKNRRALVLRGCLSASRRPQFVKFKLAGWGSGVAALNKNDYTYNKTFPETDVECYSLNSIMAAIGVHHIDFLVLDVEGSELPVLKTIDFTRLRVDVFSIEYSGEDQINKLEKIRLFFNQTDGYKEMKKLPLGTNDRFGQDIVFMRAGL